ncbi:hypothetical protein [Carbonactinospora thermoautotrophica]|uniref:hypothetical protein n=1 Tax=Carbonactinospora thermoautotrophica TaxID=1469144 RepID=UPI000B0D0D72|nr:hypothetical protein [Carbonactinospora thermoautotrophica]
MSTTGEIQRAAARRMRLLVVGLLALVMVLAAAVVWLAATRPDGDAADQGAPAPAGRASAPATVTPGAAYVAPARWVTLPAGAAQVDEYPVRFPHTPEGAAALAVAAVEYGWSLDPEHSTRVAALYAAPQVAQRAQAAAATMAAQWRQQLGLPTAGPVPAGAHVVARPIAVQWQAQGVDRVRVSVLAEVEQAAGEAQPARAELAAVTSDVVWVPGANPNGGDWRYLLSDSPLPTPQPAQIGTEEFNAAGWTAIQEVRQ